MNFWRISAKTHELMASILCCWHPYCAVGLHIVLLAYILCCWRPYCAVGVPAVLVLLLIRLCYFWHAVSGGPAVTGFLAVEGVLAVASVPADPGVPILAGGFTYWILEWGISTIELSDYGYRTVIFFCYRTIGISNIELANSRNYRTIGYRIKASIYRISDSEKTKRCPPLPARSVFSIMEAAVASLCVLCVGYSHAVFKA